MSSRLRALLFLLAPGCWAAGPGALASAEGAAADLPSRERIDGETLLLVSCGVRDTLWIDHLVAALYVPPGADPAEAVLDPGTPKLIRLDIINADWLPAQPPGEWQASLRSNLPPRRVELIEHHYRNLDAGDVVTLAYLPSEGVTVAVNGRQIAAEPGHDLIGDLLAAWSESAPPEDKLRQRISEYPC